MALNINDYIGSYMITEEFRVAGGRSRISFAEQGGKRWFVKEFLSPKYPTPDSPGSVKTKEYKRKMCEAFEEQQRKIMKITKDACSAGSNLICAKELIRKDASYYKISEAVDTSTMLPEDVSKLPIKDILSILKSLCTSLRILHMNNIVHGDLKPENVLIKKSSTTGSYYAKLIDFDDSYFSGEPNTDRDMVVGTPEYYSPEVYAYITDEDEIVPGSALTCASDIYTLGLLFCEYLTGTRPLFDGSYRYAYVATGAGEELNVPNNKNVTGTIKTLISSMLEKDFTKRPTINEVFNELKKYDPSTEKTEKSSIPFTSSVTASKYSPASTKPAVEVPKLKFGKLIGKCVDKVTTMIMAEPKKEEKPILKKRLDLSKTTCVTESKVRSENIKPRLIIRTSAH